MSVSVEQRLCQLHERRYCLLVGNGTAGIALCIEALGLRGQRIAVPDSVCINVPLGVIYSGNEPVYLDISLDSMGLSLPTFAAHAPNLQGVVAVHGYGAVCSMAELETIAARHGLPLIEDACLVQGGYIGERPAGSFGIASVISFGAGKPISLGHGGAILTDDPALYRVLQSLDQGLPAYTAEAEQAIDELGRVHTRLYNAHYGRDLEAHIEPFRQAAKAARTQFLHRFDSVLRSRLDEALVSLPGEVGQRWENWHHLQRALSVALGDRVKVLQPPQGSVPWRLNLLMEGRDDVMRSLHGKGLHCSSWHPPVSSFLGSSDDEAERPAALQVGEQILNLWVTGPAHDSYVDSVCGTLIHSIEK